MTADVGWQFLKLNKSRIQILFMRYANEARYLNVAVFIGDKHSQSNTSIVHGFYCTWDDFFSFFMRIES